MFDQQQQQQETKPQLGFGEIVSMIARHRTLFAAPIVAAVAVSVVLAFVLPKTYETSSLIRVNSRKIIDPLVSGLAISPDAKDEFDTLSKQIMAWPKLEQLVDQLHMADRVKSPVDRENYIRSLRGRVEVRSRNKNVIEISYQDESPVFAQQVVNTLTQNFIDENSRQKREEARNAIDFISDQLNIYRRKLDSSQQEFLINKIDSDLRNAENRKILLQSRMASLQQVVPSQVTTEKNPVIAQLQSYQAQLETKLARAVIDAKEGSPVVEELKGQIASVKERIAAETGGDTVKESVSTFNPMYLQTEQELKSVEMEIDYLNKRKQEFQRNGSGSLKNVSEQELANLERSKKVDEDIYQMLLRQMEAAYVSERLQDSDKGDRFAVLEYARLPLIPVKPKLPKVLGMGFILGCGLGFGLVFMIETFSKSFQTAEQVKKALNLTALGSISKIILEGQEKNNALSELNKAIDRALRKNPTLSKMKFVSPHIAKKIKETPIAPQVVVHHEPKSKIAEEYRVVRTNLFQGLESHTPLKTLLITSTLRGEGKSTTSSNVAVALADSGRRTLLIDSDLRKGVIHDVFGITATRGFADALGGAAGVDLCIVPSAVENLDILPCGTRPDKPTELLGSRKRDEILNILKNRYDNIIIDTPPVLALPDASIISAAADGVIFAVQAGRTRRRDVENAKGILTQVKAPIIGFILTNVEYYMPRYIYEYYYDYQYQ